MKINQHYSFIFSKEYHLRRHVVFWLLHIIGFTVIGYGTMPNLSSAIIISLLWIPVYMLYMYPVMYWLIPKYLLRERYGLFLTALFFWVVAWLLLNFCFRAFIMMPLVAMINSGRQVDVTRFSPLTWSYNNVFAFGSFFAMNTMLGFGSMIKLFQYFMEKQAQLLQSEKDKVIAELQLLKAQVHPHFLFNTLNNIYSYSLHSSPKAPQMIMKLSELLSYVLYECRAEKVPLKNDVQILLNYMDLEKERYGNRLDVSLNIEGNLEKITIAPLLFLPFLENAFKHGLSEQLEKPWMSLDISVNKEHLYFKLVNSIIELKPPSENGIGINNVRKRLEYLYPEKHKLKINAETGYFVVSMELETGNSFPGIIDEFSEVGETNKSLI